MAFDMDISQDYFSWLCDLVCIEQGDFSYKLLARDLHSVSFISLVPHDENRAMDGLTLRDEYLEQVNYPKYIGFDDDCSVLEMLIGLARRMNFETDSPKFDANEDSTTSWFWLLIDNLGLSGYDDEHYVELNGMKKVPRIIENWLERNYRSDGYGGLFPLNHTSEDQRNVEIWYQMNAYLRENYAI